jgi:hypothetical protein
MVTTSVVTAVQASGVQENSAACAVDRRDRPDPWVAWPRMGTAFRPIGHIAAWIVWHAMRVSLLDDLERPEPPHSA